MGFLDNLENSLKSLESREERDPAQHQRRERDRAQALAIAPWAEKLKTSEFTKKLFDAAAVEGHRRRTKIYMAWLENTLRLEAKERKLELRATPDGIAAVFIDAGQEQNTEPVDLNSEPEALLKQWLG